MRLLSHLLSLVADSSRPTNSVRAAANRSRWRPSLEALEDRTVPATVSTIASNFNGIAIAAGKSIWFSSVFKVSGVGATPVTLRVTDQTIAFRAGKTDYVVPVPDSIITLSASTVTAATTFDANQNAWVTQLPAHFRQHGFLGGVAFNVATRLPGGIKPVTWKASFATDTPGISINWQWSAAAYKSFGSDPNSFNVKPLDSSSAAHHHHSDRAGTPESFKQFVTGGARGCGGSNYTGSYSKNRKVTPTVEMPPPPSLGSLSGCVYADTDDNGIQDGADVGLSGVVISLYNSQGSVVAQTTTDDAGLYSFAGLTAGTYTIQETQPGFYEQGTNSLGSLGGVLGNDAFTIALGAGQNGLDYKFAELVPAT